MQRWGMLPLLILAIHATSIQGRQSAQAAPPLEPRAQIISLEHKYWEAWKSKDLKTLARLRSEDFREVDQDGVKNKRQAAQIDAALQVTSFTIRNERVSMVQREVALLTYEVSYTASYQGDDASSPHSYVASLYLRQNGVWRLEYSQETAANASGGN